MSSDSAPKRPRRSVRVGKYEVLSHVATGGMGVVYRAIDTSLKREVALKVLNPDLAAKPAALERFRREARHAAKLQHDNIVSIYEFGNDGNTYFLALEFVEGIDLAEYITRKSKLEPEEARQITLQACLALHQAHKHAIVHRDIKPSNFLVCRRRDRLHIKMSDFGLAREMDDDEARVTRDGTTVGTVDYMAPEQARDSGKADIRSDIYSLGCTLFHMLTGRPPFIGGGVGERLYKHISEEPPDLREFNPRISEAFCAVVRRMLAKQPEQRYQTPKELLKELKAIKAIASGSDVRATADGRDILAGLAMSDEARTGEAPAKRRRPSQESLSAVKVQRRRPDESLSVPVETPRKRSFPTPWVVGTALALGIVALGLIILLGTSTPSAPPIDNSPPPALPPPPVVDVRPTPEPETGSPTTVGKDIPNPVKPKQPPPAAATLTTASPWPAFPEPVGTVAVDTLRREYLAPWTRDQAAEPAKTTLRVARAMPVNPSSYLTLEAACAAVPGGLPSVIEIHDNGPLFLSPLAFEGKFLTIRAGAGFRPLLLWDGERPHSRGKTKLFEVRGGSLTLEGLDLAVRWREAQDVRPCLLHALDSDVMARGCSFALVSPAAMSMAAIRFETSGKSPASRCRLTECAVRGSTLVALELDAPGAEILVENSLIVGGGQPLILVAGHEAAGPTLRLMRSTLLSTGGLIRITPAPNETTPQLICHSWDTLMSRGGDETSGGSLLSVLGRGNARGVRWRPVNSLYSGWQKLLESAEAPIVSSGEWRLHWPLPEGDAVVPQPWPTVMPNDPSELGLETFALTPGAPVGYAATGGPGPIGCDLSALRGIRTSWLAFAEGAALPALDLPENRTPPEVPTAFDGKYHGGLVNLAVTDLGGFLEDLSRKKLLGPRLVLHLMGSGTFKTSPVRLKGTSLVLYFPPPSEENPPLVLTHHDGKSFPGQALIEVEGGDLEISHGEMKFHDSRLALAPPYLIKVRQGALRLYRCRLLGPIKQPPENFQGGILYETGPGQRPGSCTLNECSVIASKTAVHVQGTGAPTRLHQTVLVSPHDALRFDPGPDPSVNPPQPILLERTTVAARRAAIRVLDASPKATRIEPTTLMLRDTAILAPFSAGDPPPVFLGFEGNALARGVVFVQGENNLLDRRLSSDLAFLQGTEVRVVPGLSWATLWGTPWERRQTLEGSLRQVIDWERPPYDRLLIPGRKSRPGEPTLPTPGADLQGLGFYKPPEKPKKP